MMGVGGRKQFAPYLGALSMVIRTHRTFLGRIAYRFFHIEPVRVNNRLRLGYFLFGLKVHTRTRGRR
jgi:hypothetical protein